MNRGRPKTNAAAFIAYGVLLACLSDASQEPTCKLHERFKLRASDGEAGDNFGSPGLDGDYAVIGAWHDQHAGFHSGSAYIFRHHDNGTPADPHDDFWFEQDKLVPHDIDASDEFGANVDISGDWAVVGSMRDDDMGRDSGSAYIFRRDDNGTPLEPLDDTWVEQAKLVPTDGMETDHFGDTVAISGDHVLIGAPFHDLGLHYYFNGGSAYVYERHPHGTPDDPSDDLWLFDQELEQQNSQANDRFGIGVALEGDLAVVGSYKDDIVLTDAGAAHVFYRRADGWWVRQAMLTASDAAEYDGFGLSLDVSGSWIIVGSFYDDDLAYNSGSAYLFRVDDTGTPNDRADDTWIEHGKLTPYDGAAEDWYGYKVSIDGDWLTVSSRHDDDGGHGSLGRVGAVYVYRRDDLGTPDDLSDDAWYLHDKLRPSDVEPGDQFGHAVISGRRVLGSAHYDGGPDEFAAGSAYIFELGRQCVTLTDFAVLQCCFGTTAPGCESYDFDTDGDVDDTDYFEFLVTFSGP